MTEIVNDKIQLDKKEVTKKILEVRAKYNPASPIYGKDALKKNS